MRIPPAPFLLLALSSTLLGQVPGLSIRWKTPGAASFRDARALPLASLRLEAGESPSPFLEGRAFEAEVSGELVLEIRDRLRFAVVGEGRFELRIRGKKVCEGSGPRLESKPLRLRKGPNPIRLLWSHDGGGPAGFRILWSSEEFPWEPLPPSRLRHAPDPLEARGGELRRGRELFAEHMCAACHRPREPFPPSSMPELSFTAPSLLGLSSRLEPSWVVSWLKAPRKWRPSARMPSLLAGPDGARDARDLATALAAGAAPRRSPFRDAAEDRARGRALFSTLGCIACHHRPGSGRDPEGSRLDLGLVSSKYRPGALAAYLGDPRRFDPSGRMPDLLLEPGEARALEAFLRGEGPGPRGEGAFEAGDAERGLLLLRERGCLSCHPGDPSWGSSAHRAPALEDLPAALEGAARPWHASFGLSAEERSALAAFLRGALPSLRRRNAAETGERFFRRLRCGSCHPRDGRPDEWSLHREEVAGWAPPRRREEAGNQDPPPLTWAGEKLRPDWLEAFLARGSRDPARPWLRARMPAYPAYAWHLARGLAARHGLSTALPPRAEPDPRLAALGRRLAGKKGGFDCRLCHAAGRHPATQVFEAEGIDFAKIGRRLRKTYYDRWMWNPQRLWPSNKMPRFTDREGRTAITEILDGDARAQFDAIWAWIRKGAPLD